MHVRSYSHICPILVVVWQFGLWLGTNPLRTLNVLLVEILAREHPLGHILVMLGASYCWCVVTDALTKRLYA